MTEWAGVTPIAAGAGAWAVRAGLISLSAWLNREFGITGFDSESRKYYHARLMSGPAAVHRLEDPFAFAHAAGVQSGQAALAAMPRLQDRLAGDAGTVAYVVRGKLDQRLRPLLELEITGNPSLRCGRCLAPLDFPLQLQSRVLLMQPGAALPEDDADPESPEWLEAGQELDLLELVEDEILLELPLSVRHDEGNCSDGGGTGRTSGRDNPFSKLATLLDPK